LFFIQGRTGTDQLVEFIKKSLELLHWPRKKPKLGTTLSDIEEIGIISW
jgi:hypothetical protein